MGKSLRRVISEKIGGSRRCHEGVVCRGCTGGWRWRRRPMREGRSRGMGGSRGKSEKLPIVLLAHANCFISIWGQIRWQNQAILPHTQLILFMSTLIWWRLLSNHSFTQSSQTWVMKWFIIFLGSCHLFPPMRVRWIHAHTIYQPLCKPHLTKRRDPHNPQRQQCHIAECLASCTHYYVIILVHWINPSQLNLALLEAPGTTFKK
jgi:hypothetical protein